MASTISATNVAVRRHGGQPRGGPGHPLRGGGEIPAALTSYIRARERYDYAHHGRSGHPDTTFVPDEILDRFCVLGTADDHIAKLRDLRSRGVDQFAIYLMPDAPEETLEAYGKYVIPAFQ